MLCSEHDTEYTLHTYPRMDDGLLLFVAFGFGDPTSKGQRPNQMMRGGGAGRRQGRATGSDRMSFVCRERGFCSGAAIDESRRGHCSSPCLLC